MPLQFSKLMTQGLKDLLECFFNGRRLREGDDIEFSKSLLDVTPSIQRGIQLLLQVAGKFENFLPLGLIDLPGRDQVLDRARQAEKFQQPI